MNPEYKKIQSLCSEDYSLGIGGIDVYFRRQREHLLRHLSEAEIVVGAMAWITDVDILDALASIEAYILIQKEEFLRPDFDSGEDFCGVLREKYDKLASVRCVGLVDREKVPAIPRMHNKFLVFCKDSRPYAVWTGSYNFTINSSLSLENAIYIRNRVIAKAYAKEYYQISAISESLNWESVWIKPNMANNTQRWEKTVH